MTIAFCLAMHIVKQYFAECANADCGIRTTYNLRNIPHKNFRKIYVIEIPHSAIRIPQSTPTHRYTHCLTCLTPFVRQGY